MAARSGKKTGKKTKSASSKGDAGGSSSRKKTAKKATVKKVAKKPASKKTTAKKATTKKAASKKAASKKVVKKAASKKAPAKKASSKKVTKKPAGKKASVKKAASKKTNSKKTVAKTSASKATSKKTASKKPVSKKPAAKKVPAKKAPAKTKASSAPKSSKVSGAKSSANPESPKTNAKAGTKTQPSDGDAKKSGRKGITIVSKRPQRRAKPKPVRRSFTPPGEALLGPNSPVRKPLIPSGPSVTESGGAAATDGQNPKKSPFRKRELDKFHRLLITKRAELLGDMEQMESDALRSESGNLSHLPQHMADAGSDSYETSLSLDLAAADRRLIKEIDDALKRIDDRTYGLCEHTGRAIGVHRLNELPWARFSIEAARELERRGGL